jgi:fructokinase
MSTLDVITFGEILWDVYETGPHSFRRQLGGAPANVATALARLGVRTAVVGGVGRDRFGDALIEHLAGDAVDTRFVLRAPNRTGITFITRGETGEPEFLFYRHDSADMAMTPEHVSAKMACASWVLVGTSTMIQKPHARATVKLLELAARQGSSVHVDLNVRAHLWPDRRVMQQTIAALVRCADLVKASDADLIAVAGKNGLAWLKKHAPSATWLLTYGARGASAVGAHGVVSVPAHKAKCVDATGAGDAFIAGSLAALLASGARPGTDAWSDPEVWTRALEMGHTLGAKAVGDIGAVTGLVGLGPARRRLDTIRRSTSRP